MSRKKIIPNFLFLFIIGLSNITYSNAATINFFIPEICDNGIDDDNDGLIDCFDDDCCTSNACESFYFDPCFSNICPIEQPFGIQIQSKFDQELIFNSQFILAGDVDFDGQVEFIGQSVESDDILIIDLLTSTIEGRIPFVGQCRFSIGDVILGNNSAEIIISDVNGMYCYDINGTELWANTNNFLSNMTHINLVDFNHDGLPEIHAHQNIINGQTGEIIIKLLQETGFVGILGGAMAIDVLDDSACLWCQDVELIVGQHIVSVDVDLKVFEIIVTNTRLSAQSISMAFDRDLDGQLEIFSFSRDRIEIWNPNDISEFSQINILPGELQALPAIGNIDDDPLPEFIFVVKDIVIAYDNDFSELWRLNYENNIGLSSPILFDFNGDGKNEILVQGENFLYILNALNGGVIGLENCESSSFVSYPIVVNIDEDEEAEIITLCDEGAFTNWSSVFVYESSQDSKWSKSRPVWNQTNYYNTHINDDLSIPANAQPHQVVQGNEQLNAHLLQFSQPLLNGVDLVVSNATLNVTCNSINIRVCNEGTGDMNGNLLVSTYSGNPTSFEPDVRLISNTSQNLILPPGECINLGIQVAPSDLTTDTIFGIVNDAGTSGFPIDLENDFPNTNLIECNYLNNIFSLATGECEIVEICNNGIDDDLDGLIDVFDPDCSCGSFVNLNIIPNNEFNFHAGCCIVLEQENNCLDDWFVIEGSPEYYSTDCQPANEVEGVFVNNFDAAFILLGSIVNQNTVVSEAIGTCLTSPLNPGQNYQIEITVSIPAEILAGEQDPQVGLSVFGLIDFEDCGDMSLAISGQNQTFCNNNVNYEYQELANINSTEMQRLEWTTITIDFTATDNITAIVINASCSVTDRTILSFYQIRDIAINIPVETNWEYTSGINVISDPCSYPVVLELLDTDTTEYQWYQDSLIMNGEISNQLSLNEAEIDHNYHVYVFNETGCILIGPFMPNPPLETFSSNDTASICFGDSLFFGDEFLKIGGDYSYSFSAENGCDSIVELHLILDSYIFKTFSVSICDGDAYPFSEEQLMVAGNYRDTVSGDMSCDSVLILTLSVFSKSPVTELNEVLCEGDPFIFNGTDIYEAGMYLDTLLNSNQCDSVIALNIIFLPSDVLNLTFEICTGAEILVGDTTIFDEGFYRIRRQNQFGCDSIINVDVSFLEVIEGDTIFIEINEGESFSFGELTYEIEGFYRDTFTTAQSCDSISYLNLIVLKELLVVFIPNVINVNSNVGNNQLTVFSNKELMIKKYEIFDRWGNQIYLAENFSSLEITEFWNGKNVGGVYQLGVYVYSIETVNNEGEEKQYFGNVTLLN